MNWNIFKKADVESKDRLKCSQCHVYLPENYLDATCEFCLGSKSRKEEKKKKQKIKVHTPEPTAEPGPVQELDLELHGTGPEPTAERHYTSTSDLQLRSGKCEGCGAIVPGLLSRYCINCSIKAIHYE